VSHSWWVVYFMPTRKFASQRWEAQDILIFLISEIGDAGRRRLTPWDTLYDARDRGARSGVDGRPLNGVNRPVGP